MAFVLCLVLALTLLPTAALAAPNGCIAFTSAGAFTLEASGGKTWNGTLEYSTDGTSWTVWDGAQIAAAASGSEYTLLLRGTGNTVITGSDDYTKHWKLNGSGIACTGNIENLLDHTTATPPSSGMTAPLITDPTADKTVIVTEGNTGTLSVTASGTEPMSYQWQIDHNDGEGFKDIPDTNSSSYTTSLTELENDGYKYRCIVSNEAGSATSPTFTLQVIEYTDIPQTGDNSHLGLWLGLALLSLAGFAVTMVQRRRLQG